MSLQSEVEFSFNFLKHLNASKNSTIYSPSSLLHLLSMIYAGADGNTAQQIVDVIGKDKTRKEIIKYYSELIKRHNPINDKQSEEEKEVVPQKKRKKDDETDNSESVKIYVANKFFVQKGLEILSDYRNIIQQDFESDLQEVNFEENIATAEKINNFVKDSTKNMIPEILKAVDIDSQTSAAIINAVYFNGTWEKPFNDRRKIEFYSNPVREIFAMSTRPEKGDWNFQSGKGWTSLGIPYKSRKGWMFIVLPEKTDGLEEMMKNMDYKFFEKVTTRRKSGKLGVTIPVMDVTTTIDLPEYLNKLKITDAFNEKCDLTKMFKEKNTIDKAIHKAAIKVDERGTEASAASIGTPRAMSSPGFFSATHPFLYFIISTENSESISPKDILFMGTFC